MKTSSKIFIIIIVTLFATKLSAQEWTAEQKEVWQVIENTWKNLQAGNVDPSFYVFHEKYQGWSNSEPLPLSKEKAIQVFQHLKDTWKIPDYSINPARIAVVGNAAVVHYYFHFTLVVAVGDEKKTNDMKGKYTEFYIKEDGKWLCLGDMTVYEE
jgi:hypothetical protein